MRNTLAVPGDTITHQVGRTVIRLQYVRENAYTVTVEQGTLRIDDNCGSYTTEAEARLIARGYAHMYRAEQQQTNPLHQLAAQGRHRQIRPTLAGAHLANPSDPAQRVLRAAHANGGTIARSKAATVVQLQALARKGLVTLNYQSGTGRRRVVESATLTESGIKAVTR